MEQERTRIAQDLHDDLGSGITEISMLVSRANFGSAPDEKRHQYLDWSVKKPREMVTVLDEIVWAMNPKHDSLASLVSYFCIYADRFLGLANITWRLENASGAANPMVDSRCRHQLFLAFKEALTNVVRHAGASEVLLEHSRGKRRIMAECLRQWPRIFNRPRRVKPWTAWPTCARALRNWAADLKSPATPNRGTTVRFYVPSIKSP